MSDRKRYLLSFISHLSQSVTFRTDKSTKPSGPGSVMSAWGPQISPPCMDPAEWLLLALLLPRFRGRVLVLSTVVPPVRICLTDGLWPCFSWSECPWECMCPPWEWTRPAGAIMWGCPWGMVLIVP
ncbi:hypothetical protein EYF80_001639 [Liparis tanakae]|uniref:Uncharacterized protein n=1 Tax=Liparis tanakae TaxID=230148 RepID=A0A4Z2JEI2_9TELE|nr:hypothetical protein EYF80_001639 [Liparis tanakae]